MKEHKEKEVKQPTASIDLLDMDISVPEEKKEVKTPVKSV